MLESERQDVETRIRAACWALVTTWHRMLPTAPKTITHGTIGRTDNRPLVIPVHTLDTRREALDRLTGWATVVVEGRGLRPNIDVNDAPALAKLVEAHAQWLSLHDGGKDAATELFDSAKKCGRIADPDRPEERFAGICPTCAVRVYVPAGATNTVCRGCRAALVVSDVVEAAEGLVADRLDTASAISDLLRALHGKLVTPAMIRGYAARGRIAAHGQQRDTRGRLVPAYRIGDVVAAAERANADPEERRAARRAAEDVA